MSWFTIWLKKSWLSSIEDYGCNNDEWNWVMVSPS